MGCCQAQENKDKSKDEPLLAEHMSKQDNAINAVTSATTTTASTSDIQIESTPIVKNGSSDPQSTDTAEATVETIDRTAENTVEDIAGSTAAEVDDKKAQEQKQPEQLEDAAGAPDVAENPIADDREEKSSARAPQPSKKRRKTHKRTDSKIDIQNLIQFDQFTEKMSQLEKIKEEAKLIELKMKSMDLQFPLFSLEIDQNSSVASLKQQIAAQSPDKVEPYRQRIVHKGRLLKDSRTLLQYKIQSGETLMLVRSRAHASTVVSLSAENKSDSANKNSANGGIKRGRGRRHRAMTLAPELAPHQLSPRAKTPSPEVY